MPLLIILFTCLFLSSCSYFQLKENNPDKAAVENKASPIKKPEPKSLKEKPVAKAGKKASKTPATSAKANTQKTPVAASKPLATKTQPKSLTPTKAKPTPAKKAPKVAAKATPTPTPTPTPKALTKAPVQATVRPGKLSGVLEVINGQKQMPPENALVTLTRLNVKQKTPTKNQTKRINMTNKAYQPQFVLLSPGDTLAFKNNDSIKHNVFSSSKNNSFDLGTYGYNRVVEQQIKNEGIVKVYCNIHPEMALFVAVSKTQFKAITDSQGKFAISDVPPGRYRLNIWHLRGEQKFNVQIASNGHVQKTFTLNTESFTPKKHLNKFGKPYKKKPVLFQDEFY